MLPENSINVPEEWKVYKSQVPKMGKKGEWKIDGKKIPCTEKEQMGARSIFAIIYGSELTTPTVIHGCKRTELAASLRACGNLNTEDPVVFAKYEHWFKKKYVPGFLKYLDEEGPRTIDVEEWLRGGRYNKAYQDNLRKAFFNDNRTYKETVRGFRRNLKYKCFPKQELQFTEVPHEMKDDPVNDVKERQICGPTDEKKMMANAFINFLEYIADKYMKEYCGRKNWIQICEEINDSLQTIPDHIGGESDGSGFDMTQREKHNLLMNYLIMSCARHPNITFKEPLTLEDLERALEESITIHATAADGDIEYKAKGRASGDGWTTFGNTMLMISYWLYTFYIAEEKFSVKFDKMLKVKGDDVLMALPKSLIDKLKWAIDIVFTKTKGLIQHGLGQICKLVKFGDMQELSFLSNYFFWTAKDKLRMTRIPARIFQTNCWSTKIPNCKPKKMEEMRQGLCFAKGKCLKAWADGLPIFSVLADKMIELGRKNQYSVIDKYADEPRMWHQGRNDYDAYCEFLSFRFGLNRKEVFEIERKIKAITSKTDVVQIKQLDVFFSYVV